MLVFLINVGKMCCVLLVFTALVLQGFLVYIINLENWRMVVFFLIISIPCLLYAYLYTVIWNMTKNKDLKMVHKLIFCAVLLVIGFIFGTTLWKSSLDIFDTEYIYEGNCFIKIVTHTRWRDSYYLVIHSKDEIEIRQNDYFTLRGAPIGKPYPYQCAAPVRVVYLRHLGIALEITPISMEK